MGDKGSRVNVDLTAKASLEVKAEVPKESAGRTLDALEHFSIRLGVA